MPASPISTNPASTFYAADFSKGRLFETNDSEEARELCGRVFNPHQLQVLGLGTRVSAAMDHLPLGALSLNRLTWGAPVRVDPDRLGNYFLISVPTRGLARFQVGRETLEMSSRCAGIICSSARFHFQADAQFEQVVIRIEEESIRQAWTALSGAPAPLQLELTANLPIDSAAWRAIEPTLRLIAASSAHPSVHVLNRLQDMLLTGLLLHQAPQLRIGEPTLPKTSTAALVRRSQEWILEHLSEPLSVASMALAEGVSKRTLQAAFQAQCGCGPMQWLRAQRLEAVHLALRRPSADTRVTATALFYGFSHLGEFAAMYRRRFGENPGHTLQRGR